MPSRPSPVCFVAMAFDMPDTDALYDGQILPVLRRNHIKPVIINRRQSNTDLNIQIVDQMKKADFCIADLTYARPSVYWEAGFSERTLPVIYSVRKDHLSPTQPDDLRVHFDLQMKPLLLWKDPHDATFAGRLEKRIKATVLKEWLARQAQHAADEDAVRSFRSLSPAERLVIMRARAISALSSLGYAEWLSLSRLQGTYRPEDIFAGRVNNTFSYRHGRGSFHFVSIHAFDSPSKAEVQRLQSELYSSYDGRLRAPAVQIPEVEITFANHILMSIRAVPIDRVERALPKLRLVSPPSIFAGVSAAGRGSRGQGASPSVVFQSWHFLSAISSEPQLGEALRASTAEYIALQAA